MRDHVGFDAGETTAHRDPSNNITSRNPTALGRHPRSQLRWRGTVPHLEPRSCRHGALGIPACGSTPRSRLARISVSTRFSSSSGGFGGRPTCVFPRGSRNARPRPGRPPQLDLPAALVDEPVLVLAQERGIREARLAAVGPMDDVVALVEPEAAGTARPRRVVWKPQPRSLTSSARRNGPETVRCLRPTFRIWPAGARMTGTTPQSQESLRVVSAGTFVPPSSSDMPARPRARATRARRGGPGLRLSAFTSDTSGSDQENGANERGRREPCRIPYPLSSPSSGIIIPPPLQDTGESHSAINTRRRNRLKAS